MDFMWRYHGAKGVREYKVEDGSLGNLASPGHREESASHHIPIRMDKNPSESAYIDSYDFIRVASSFL